MLFFTPPTAFNQQASQVAGDATAAAQIVEGDGYEAAMVNFRFIANTVWTTKRAVKGIS
jgi:hypothetical protein